MKETLKKTSLPFKNLIHSPLGFQLVSLSLLFIFVFSFRPNHFTRNNELFGEFGSPAQTEHFSIREEGFIDNHYGVSTAGSREIVIVNENGEEIVKVLPKQRQKTIFHKVKSGETIASIAHKFGLNVSSINWANDLTSKSTVKIGQELKIPPTDGIYYKIESGDTLSEIAKIHQTELQKIYAFNSINSKKLHAGKEIFIPEAKKVHIIRNLDISPNQGKIAKNNSNKPTKTYNKPKISVPPSQTIASMGTKIQRPTQGVLTQGYHRGHYALDIANKMNTPIYAAAGGTVIKSSDGWNYGYGNYIVIDHGNGIQTLYGHNNVRKVEVGDTVKRGQLIALMGNSGRVFGVTGIHLHFELRINGRKVNPNNYF